MGVRPLLVGILLAVLSLGVEAHPGGVAADGCHSAAAGERHCHDEPSKKAKTSSESFSGEVVRVLDGDTVEALRGAKRRRIRLFGIDAPERHQAHSQAARKRLGDLVHGKTVQVLVRDQDRYGRLVAELLLADGTNVNLELVRAGYAWWYQRYAPSHRELSRAEAEARAAKRGLWVDKDPVAPSLFRRAKGRQPVM